jgi:RHS repeat-associated protein
MAQKGIQVKLVLSILLSIIVMLQYSDVARAQDGPPANIGAPENVAFHGSDIDAVQMDNGGLTVNLDLSETQGRQISTGYKLVYNSKNWRLNQQCSDTQCVDSVRQTLPGVPINIVGPLLPAVSVGHSTYSQFCNGANAVVSNNFVIREIDGTIHHFVPDGIGQAGCNIPSTLDRYADDGSGWMIKGGVTALRKDGSSVMVSTGASTTVTTVRDPNGNQVVSTLDLNSQATTSTDTLGRTVPSPAYYDANGVLRTLQVETTSLSVQTHLCPPQAICSEKSTIWTVPSKITFPNGLFYSFTYESTNGQLTSITLPSGATISYTYAEAFYESDTPDPNGWRVQTRTVTQGTQSYVWHYSYAFAPSSILPQFETTTVIDPLGNQTIYHSTHLANGGAAFATTGPDVGGSAQITEVDFYSGNGSGAQLLKKVQTEYWTVEILKPKATTTTVYSSLPGDATVVKNRVETDYDTQTISAWDTVGNPVTAHITRGNVVESREFTYDSSGNNPALARRTHFTYLSDTNSQYLNLNMSDRVTDKSVYECVAQACTPPGTIGSYGTPYSGGTLVSETQYTYDDTAVVNADNLPTPPASVPGHDDADYGTSYTLRGNPTHTKIWLNTSNSWVTTSNIYDVLGHLVSTTDPGGHTSTMSYSDDWNGWNLTTACLPSSNSFAFLTDAANALGQHRHTTYFPCTGQTQSNQDQNDINASRSGTTYTYDAMKRLLTKNYAGGGQNSFSYSDSVTDLSATETTKITNSISHIVKTSYDSLGRAITTTVLSDPDGATRTDVTYDELGRKKTVTNPYRSTSDPTYGITTYFYDALGRTVTTAPPDGTQTANNNTTQYGGNYSVSTDPAGNQRRRFFDSLGRLSEVDEPGDAFAGSQANGSIGIGGALQSTVVGATNAAAGTGNLTITGSEGSVTTGGDRYCALWNENGDCVDWEINPLITTYDFGTITISVNGHSDHTTYNSGSDINSIASGLASAINADSSAFITASASGGVLHLTARQTGASTNYAWSLSTSSGDPGDFGASGSFGSSPASGTLAGGTNGSSGTTVYDAGTVTITIGTFTASATYGQSTNGTASAVAAALASTGVSGLNRSGSPVHATASGSSLTISYSSVGASGNITLGCGSSSSQTVYFSSPSFSCPASASLTGGSNPEGPSLDHNYYATLYSYDALNNLLHVEQHGDTSDTSKWRVRTFVYDSLSRLTQSNNPETGTINFAYDNDGNLATKNSPAPNQLSSSVRLTINYTYDALHRNTGTTYSNGDPAVSYLYDQSSFNGLTITNGIGYRTGMSDGSGQTAWSFDFEGRKLVERRTIGAVTKSAGYTYNLDGSIATIGYPSGSTVTYIPAASGGNSAGRTGAVQDSGNNINYVTGSTGPGSFAAYEADGSIATYLNGYAAGFTGITNTFSYDARLQPVSVQAASPAATIFNIGYDFHLGNGDNGNVYQLINNKDTTRSQIFTYDPLNRIASAKTSSSTLWGNNYVYDPWGNLTQKNPMAGMQDGENFPHSALVNNQLTGFSYDAAGNTISDGSNTYVYDGENEISSAAGVTYTYDGEGGRVKKSNGRLYWFESLTESDLNGNITAEYVMFNGQRVARRDLPSGAVHYYFSDHLKSVGLVTNASGGIEEESDYYPWGSERTITHTLSDQHFKFNGKERDSESGFDEFGARFYSSAWGRWLTPDWSATPIPVPYAQMDNPQSLNLYAYVLNAPTSKADIDGHCPIPTLCEVIGIVTGIYRDGGVKPYLKNVAIGSGKGVGSFVVNTVQMAAAGGSTNPGKVAAAMVDPGPKSLQPSNLTQAQASIVTQNVLSAATAVLPGAAENSVSRAASNLTPAEIQAGIASSDATLRTPQTAISAPMVNRYIDMLRAGTDPAPIQVDGDIIVGGNHRYAAGLLEGKLPDTTPWTASSTQVKDAKPFKEITVSPNDFNNNP